MDASATENCDAEPIRFAKTVYLLAYNTHTHKNPKCWHRGAQIQGVWSPERLNCVG